MTDVALGCGEMQRIQACGRLSVRAREGRSRLDRLFQEGAARIRLPRIPGSAVEAILINTGGGLTGGDRLSWEVEAGSGTSLVATTQACEKIYRAGEGHAQVLIRLRAGAEADLAWLPQETILFDKSALLRQIEVDLDKTARALIVESAIFGRTAMGETVEHASLHDRWRVRVEGRLVHSEEVALEGPVSRILSRGATAAGALAMATVLMIGEDAEQHAGCVQELLAPSDGVSAWRVGGTGKLLARLTAKDGHALRQRLIPLLQVLSGEAGLPRIWSS